jgi:hypothetical protein
MDFEGKKLVTEVFGEWPDFHDAEVKRFSFSTPSQTGDLSSAEMEIHCWELTSELNDKGCYILKNHSLVTFLFSQLEGISMNGFNHQNAIFSLNISNLAPEKVGVVAWNVRAEPSFGVEFELQCQRIIVTSVIKCDENGIPMV